MDIRGVKWDLLWIDRLAIASFGVCPIMGVLKENPMFLSTSGGGAGTFSGRRFILRMAVAAALAAIPAARGLAEQAPPPSLAPQQGRFVSLAEQAGVELFVWQDICNVYVLREG